jgi:hypothetical protein
VTRSILSSGRVWSAIQGQLLDGVDSYDALRIIFKDTGKSISTYIGWYLTRKNPCESLTARVNHTSNIISEIQFLKSGFSISKTPKSISITNDMGVEILSDSINCPRSHLMKSTLRIVAATSVVERITLTEAHERYGHLSDEKVRAAAAQSIPQVQIIKNRLDCAPFIISNAPRIPQSSQRISSHTQSTMLIIRVTVFFSRSLTIHRQEPKSHFFRKFGQLCIVKNYPARGNLEHRGFPAYVIGHGGQPSEYIV